MKIGKANIVFEVLQKSVTFVLLFSFFVSIGFAAFHSVYHKDERLCNHSETVHICKTEIESSHNEICKFCTNFFSESLLKPEIKFSHNFSPKEIKYYQNISKLLCNSFSFSSDRAPPTID